MYSDARLVQFVEEAWPVIVNNCTRCHHPAGRRVGDLDLTTIAGLLEGGVSGPGVVPGNAEESWIVKAMKHEEELVMPADAEDDEKLPDDVIAKVEAWINAGAVWTDAVLQATSDEPTSDE